MTSTPGGLSESVTNETAETGVAIDRSSFVPLYYQLALILWERLASGRLSPGDKLPSESELSTEFGISRSVIRPALTSLITQQVGRGEQGAVLGLNQSLMSVAQIVGPAIAGALIDRGWLSTWAFWTALITIVAVVLNRNAREARHAAANHLERA